MSLLKEYPLIFQEGTEDKVSLERKVPLILLRQETVSFVFLPGVCIEMMFLRRGVKGKGMEGHPTQREMFGLPFSEGQHHTFLKVTSLTWD